MKIFFNICVGGGGSALILDNFLEVIYLFVLIKVRTGNIYLWRICYIVRCMLDISDFFVITADAGAKLM